MADTNIVFVFGSNLAGRHGAGAALSARLQYGAIYGQGEGLQGRSYAIPTKDGRDGGSLSRPSQILELRVIKKYVDNFLRFAARNPQLTFKVTAIGTGKAGFSHDDIGPMFCNAPPNCVLPTKWKDYMMDAESRKYWVS